MQNFTRHRRSQSAAVIALGAFAALCALLGILPLANLQTQGKAIGWWGGAVREWSVRGGIVLIASLGIAVALGRRLDTVIERAKELLLRPSAMAFSLGVSILALLSSAVLSQYCFAGQPFTSDEMAQLWHARILLSGHLVLPAEAHREFFNTAPVLDQAGHWFSQYPIGGPFFIAIGLAVGAAWLVNPILLGLATWQLYRFVRSAMTDELTARSTTILFVLSPMVLIMAASQMSHVPALAFAMLALASLADWDRARTARERWFRATVIGISLGIVVAVRPLDGALVALAVGGFQIWRMIDVHDRWRDLLIQCAAGLSPVLLLLWANARMTGSPFVFGYDLLNGPGHRLGFHMAPNGEMHTPLHGVILASGYLLRLDRFLFEWPIPALLAVIVGVVGILAAKKTSRWDVLLAGIATAFLVGYGAYWFDGFFAGPRFLFAALPAFVYFAARGPIAGAAVFAERPTARRAALLVLPICAVVSWLGPLGISSAAARVLLYRDQRTKLKTDVEEQIRRADLRNALVFVNESWRGRLLARLRVLGVQQFEAERVLNTVDACALQTALDGEDSLAAFDAGERRARVLTRARESGRAQLVKGLAADQTIALVPGSTPTSVCLREVERDASGSMPFALFLAQQEIDSSGRVGGNVVFARDLGARNELLRERFGDRTWYRYRQAADLSDTSVAFVRYADPSRTADVRASR